MAYDRIGTLIEQFFSCLMSPRWLEETIEEIQKYDDPRVPGFAAVLDTAWNIKQFMRGVPPRG